MRDGSVTMFHHWSYMTSDTIPDCLHCNTVLKWKRASSSDKSNYWDDPWGFKEHARWRETRSSFDATAATPEAA